MFPIAKLFTRRWWLTTLIVIAAVIFMVYLGVWQLDRRAQRQAFNQIVVDQWRLEPIDLNEGTDVDLSSLEYRRVEAAGTFDFENQVVLTNQVWQQQAGTQLVTPLLLDDNKAVLIVRGWVPAREGVPEKWAQFDEAPNAALIGRAHESQMMPSGEAPDVPENAQQEWFRININAIQPQMPYELLPFFLLQLPEEGRSINNYPVRQDRSPIYELRDPVMHTSYAVQWFMFALILGFGYLQFVRWQEMRDARLRAEEEQTIPSIELASESKLS